MSRKEAEDAAFKIGTTFMSLYCMACARKCVDKVCPFCRQYTEEKGTQTPKKWSNFTPSAPVMSQPQRTYGTFGGVKERYYTANSNASGSSSDSSSSNLSWKSYSNKPSWKN